MQRSPFPALIGGLAALALAVPAAAEGQPLRVVRAAAPIKIDAVLDDPAWQDALRVPLRREWFPGDGVEPPVRTEALLSFDERHVYVAFRCHDPDPASIRAHLMDRDTINTFVQDDHVTVMIDPFNDERRAFQFRVNPLGVQADAIFSEVDGIEDFSWDIIWESAGRITDDGYVVELAIPVNQIRFPSGQAVQTWGVELGRSYPRKVRHRIAANYRDRNRNCLLCQLDKVEGFQGLEPGRNLELDPTLTVGRLDELRSFPDGGLESGDEDFEPGLTARWSMTPSLTLGAAINPDFSQVEADVAQLNVNERFALFFPEKRPFFLEGVDFFATPINAVFTRTVRDLEWGGKFTGKQAGHGFGVFVARDDDPPPVIIPGNEASGILDLPGEIDTGVVRYRRDVRANSTLGLLLTVRDGDDYHNRVGGVDGFLRLSQVDSLRFQYLRSDTRYPGAAGSLDDDAFVVDYDHVSRNWVASVEYEDRGPLFRADAGFLPRVDTRSVQAFGQRRFWGGEDDWYSQVNVGLLVERVEDAAGDLTDEELDVFANFSGPLQSFAEISLERNRQRFGNVLFDDLERVQLFFQFQPSGLLRFETFVDRGDVIDFFNVQRAEQLLIAPGIEIKPGRHLNAQLDYTRQTLDVPGGELFDASITELRTVYQFNVRAFLRAILQLRRTERDLELFGFCVADPADCPFAPEEERLFTQLLFSYKLNPQTVIFLGYTDNRADVFPDPGGPPLTSSGLEQTNRFFFLKLGYAWLL